jgi:hypothetical protein
MPAMSPFEYAFIHSLMRLNRDRAYLEYGSGGSTILADRFFDKIYSADTDVLWCEKINQCIKHGVVRCVDVGEVSEWGYPKELSEQKARQIVTVHDADIAALRKGNANFFVFLDGRCRVLTASLLHSQLTEDDLVLMHDFTCRRIYYDVLKIYDIVTVCGSLVLLKKHNAENCIRSARSLAEEHRCDFD